MPKHRDSDDALTFSESQRDFLFRAKVWWQEGEQADEYLAERARQEIRRDQLRTAFEELRSERAPKAALVVPILRLSRQLSANRALNRTLETDDFARALRTLVYGEEPLPARLTEFLQTARIGTQTASHLLFAASSERFPLVSEATRTVLAPTSAQRTAARTAAAKEYALPADTPRPLLNLLADFAIYEAARRLLSLADFLELNAVLWHAREMPKPIQRRIAKGKSAGQIREKRLEYVSESEIVPPPEPTEADLLTYIEGFIAAQGFTFPPLTVRNYYISLKAKPFVILTGLSGTGKTRLTRLFADALTGGIPDQYLLLPVRPDWTDGTPLFGYYNIITDRYVSTAFLEILHRAGQPENRERPFFVVFDEMNLSSPNHYLSDILSIMEASDKTLTLHEGRTITLPPNVFLTGTLNIDEASHQISKKVLDRANTIEFTDVSFVEQAPVPLTVLPQIPSPERQRLFLENRVLTLLEARERLESVDPTFSSKIISMLSAVNEILVGRTLHFAYRIRDEVMRYVAASFYRDGRGILVKEPSMNLQIAFDLQMMQKVLPRITGTTESLDRLMIDLESWAIRENLTRSAAKIARMRRRAAEDGFVTFYDV